MSVRAELKINLSGLDEIEKTAQKRAISLKAARAGAKIVRADMRARAPRGSGALASRSG